MKKETFYRKFANLPLTKRDVSLHIIGKSGYVSYTPLELYKSINSADEKRRLAQIELEELLFIAEKILH